MHVESLLQSQEPQDEPHEPFVGSGSEQARAGQLKSPGHRRRERALPEHGFPQTGDKPVFVHRLEAMMDDARHFEAHGVGTDIDRSKDAQARSLAPRRTLPRDSNGILQR